ncbi:dual specificity protein phosphatase Mpk3 [Planococcus citri]|uniref:dual specificity protein phosphatase Mpk3 n=1 Tax=Planococcus citri TaxID=170843 RepID=UPI0031F78F68
MIMPAEEENSLEQSLIQSTYVNKEWLFEELLLDKTRIVVLDCRSSNEYGESHIRHAVNFSIPSIMLRRLAAGKIDLLSTIRSRELKEKIMNAYKDNIFVVYGDMINDQRNSASDTIHVLMRRLLKDGCRAVCLRDGFNEFHRAYPEWCESCSELLESPGAGADLATSDPNVTVPLMGLQSLRISSSAVTFARQKTPALPSSSTEDSSSDSEHLDTAASLGFDDDRDFPIEIVPYLYLGNAANSEDLEALSRHGIKYILNVTPDLPNKFEKTSSMKYMQIPIADHWSQNLASFFPKAIQFIDEGRSQKIGVLVHCLAGVSRSVTITVAYLMSHMSLSLNDAFSLVRSRKSNVGPNFYFMEQLHAYERELTNSSSSKRSGQSSIDSGDGGGDESGLSSASSSADRKCDQCGTPRTSTACSRCQVAAHFLSPLTVFGQSPDSGIEFDRWTPGTGE